MTAPVQADPEPVSLHARLLTTLTTLSAASPAVARLLEVMLADPAGASQLTVGGLAARASTSQASVVRAARAVGYPGYPQLRLALAASAVRRPPARPADRYLGLIADHDDMDRVVSTLAELETEALDATAATVDRRVLEMTADRLAQARVVDCYGIGASSLVALDLDQKLSRVGVVSRARVEAHAALTSAALLRSGDVVVAVSHGGRTPAVLEATRTARRGGATTVAVTSDSGSPLASVAEHVLFVAGRETPYRAGAMASRTSCLLVVDCLYVAVIQRLGDPARRALDATHRAVGPAAGLPPSEG